MNRTYDEWLKYYENATKEQVIEDMMLDIKEINRLKTKQWQIKELKKEWLDINENSTLVFENNNLIEFMNKLENILKGEDKE